KAEVLPLNYSRAGLTCLGTAPTVGNAIGYCIFHHRPGIMMKPDRGEAGGGRWIRTTEGVSQQIYSLPPLAAWVSLQKSPQFWCCIRRMSTRPGNFLRRPRAVRR